MADTVAAFDFDGTLTHRDTLLPFLRWYAGWPSYVAGLGSQFPFLIAFALGGMDNGAAKERVLRQFLAMRPLDELAHAGARFADQRLTGLLRLAGMRQLAWHQRQGHRCIVVSASLDIYLRPWSRAAGISDVVCSRLEMDRQGRATGRLDGGNCYGPEKVRRLEALVGPLRSFELYVYGDGRGDRELLAVADHAHYRHFPHGA